jgi:integrase
MFLYGSGARIGEAPKIRWNQVDLTTAEIRLHDNQTKNGEPRILPLSADLVGVLKKMFRTDGPVFCTTNLRRAWQDACVAAGFGEWEKTPTLKKGRIYRGVLIHDLRRSAVRNLIRAGVSESVAMKISGHKTREVFQRYNITSTSDLHSAAAAVQRNNERLMKAAARKAAKHINEAV